MTKEHSKILLCSFSYESMKVIDRLIVALDTDTIDEAINLVNILKDVTFFKIGLRLLYDTRINELFNYLSNKRIFVDAKLYDIPATVEHAVRNIVKRKNVEFITVHSELDILQAAILGCSNTQTKILAVTVLTSMPEMLDTKKLIEKRIECAIQASCCGVIVSAKDDLNNFRNMKKDLIIVTPGIRMPTDDNDDQKRVSTPYNAVKSGSDYIVVGRPIINSNNPNLAVTMIVDNMKQTERE